MAIMKMNATILLKCIILSSVIIADGYIMNDHRISLSKGGIIPSKARLSPLFLPPTTNTKKMDLCLAQSDPSLRMLPLSMVSDNDSNDSSDKEANGIEEKNRESETRAADGNLLKNVFLMVPLLAKFVVVLVVKFITDIIVFPLLILYRLVQKMKNSIWSILTNKKDEDSVIDYDI